MGKKYAAQIVAASVAFDIAESYHVRMDESTMFRLPCARARVRGAIEFEFALSEDDSNAIAVIIERAARQALTHIHINPEG